MSHTRGRLFLLALALSLAAASWLAAGRATSPLHAAPAPNAPRPTAPPAKPPAIVIRSVNTQEKLVALTFDDGPDPKYTPMVLDIARQRHIPLTFFLVGSHVRLYPELARRMLAEGHVIGNHTWSHSVMLGRNDAEDVAEIEACGLELEKVCGQRPSLLRPPKGYLDDSVIRAATGLGDQIILWTVGLEHHESTGADAMAKRAANRVRPGSIILAHDGWRANRDRTIAAFPLLVDELRKRGYTFVTVPDLLSRATDKSIPRGRS